MGNGSAGWACAKAWWAECWAGFALLGLIEAMQNQKGIATTISVALLLVALLSLTAAIANYSGRMREANSGLAQIAGVQEQADEAAYGAQKLADAYGMGVKLDGNRTIISQDLTSLYLYSLSMSGWETFLAAHGSGASLNSSEASIPKIYVSPQNITMWYNDNDSLCANCKGFQVNGSAASLANVTGYTITVRVLVNVTNLTASGGCGSTNATSLTIYTEDIMSAITPRGTWCADRDSSRRVDIISGTDVIASANVSDGGALHFGYDWRNVYLTVDAELNSVPSYAEIGRSAAGAKSGSVQKQGRVLIG